MSKRSSRKHRRRLNSSIEGGAVSRVRGVMCTNIVIDEAVPAGSLSRFLELDVDPATGLPRIRITNENMNDDDDSINWMRYFSIGNTYSYLAPMDSARHAGEVAGERLTIPWSSFVHFSRQELSEHDRLNGFADVERFLCNITRQKVMAASVALMADLRNNSQAGVLELKAFLSLGVVYAIARQVRTHDTRMRERASQIIYELWPPLQLWLQHRSPAEGVVYAMINEHDAALVTGIIQSLYAWCPAGYIGFTPWNLRAKDPMFTFYLSLGYENRRYREDVFTGVAWQPAASEGSRAVANSTTLSAMDVRPRQILDF